MASSECQSSSNTTVSDSWRNCNKEELRKQFSPSEWSATHSSTTVIPHYVETVKKGLAECRQKLQWKSYPIEDDSKSPSLELDVYSANFSKVASDMFIFVHGGYWQELSKEMVGGMMGPLSESNTVTVILPYTLAPHGNIPDMIQEIQKGLLKSMTLAKEFGIENVTLCGWSAGGQLILQALALSPVFSLLKNVIIISGIYDLRPLVDTYVNEPLKLTEDSAWCLSPSNHINIEQLQKYQNTDISFRLLVAEYDSDQFKLQCRNYLQLLESLSFSQESLSIDIVEGRDHFDIISAMADKEANITRLLESYIKKTRN